MQNHRLNTLLFLLINTVISSRIFISDGKFVDENGRSVLLRGVNLGGNSKLPSIPNTDTFVPNNPYNHRQVSFVNRPFPLEEADQHLTRLKSYGFNFARLLITWEALEHEGPGKYDDEYVRYMIRILEKCREHDMKVFIDPHQDVWSRLSGGSGAPGWTLELAGFDLRNLHDTGAAYLQNHTPDPYNIPMMIWPTNYHKVATSTMFTLFWAGLRYAPNARFARAPDGEYVPSDSDDSLNIESILQTHFIDSYLYLIRQIIETDASLLDQVVVGYETMNEPSGGYIGYKNLKIIKNTGILKGAMPTPAQGFQICAGNTVQVDTYAVGMFGFAKSGKTTLNLFKKRCFYPGRNIWENEGIIDAQGNLRTGFEHYFSTYDQMSWMQDYYAPFAKSMSNQIRRLHPNALIFIEGETFVPPPTIPDAPDYNFVYAPHFYDGLTLLKKKYQNYNLDAVGLTRGENSLETLRIGTNGVKNALSQSLSHFKTDAKKYLGNIPLIIGEIGIPYDMENKKAFETQDFSLQELSMEASVAALDMQLLSYTLWNYNPSNTFEKGDGWNGEDLSIVTKGNNDNGPLFSRAESAFNRPYTQYTNGELKSMIYHNGKVSEKRFVFVFQPETICKGDKGSKTVFFLPKSFGQVPIFVVKGSQGRIEVSEDDRLFKFCNADLAETTIKVYPNFKSFHFDPFS